jgi:hypothetical protein
LSIKSGTLCLLAALLAVPVAFADVVINEMEVNPPEGGSHWVELYNSGNDTVDISSWTVTITDGGWVGKMPPVPQGTIIAPKGFYVVTGSSQWTHNDGGFGSLFTDAGVKVDETPFRLDSLDNDFTWGRRPDGYDTNTDGDFGQGYATKGRSNER